MSEQDMNKLKKLADGHTMTPRPDAWKKLNNKLKAKKAKKKGKRGQSKVDNSGDKFIELRGMAMDDQAVIHFLDKLRGIPYIDAVVLHTSKREWMENQPVQKFDVYCHFLKTKPAA